MNQITERIDRKRATGAVPTFAARFAEVLPAGAQPLGLFRSDTQCGHAQPAPTGLAGHSMTLSLASLTFESRQVMLSNLWIGEPARKHRVIDTDILHAVRTAMRRDVIDEDLTMLIGPASDGALLEIGVLDIDGDDLVVIHAMPLRQKFYRFLE
jgi:hypothetical protein